MNKWMIRQTINLARSGSGPQVWPEALMVEGDKNAHTWEITICDGNNVPDFTGASIKVYFTRADNKAVMVAGSITGNVASVTLEQQCYAIPGPMVGVFRLTTEAGTKMTLSVMRFLVARGPASQIIDPGEIIPDLDELLAQIDKMESVTADATAATADANAAAVAANAAATTAEANAAQAVADAAAATADANAAAAAANAAADAASADVANAIASAEAAAGAASEAAEEANAAAEAANSVAEIVDDALASKIDGAYVENGLLYLTAGGNVVEGPLEVGSGGSGGGSTNNAIMKLSNTSGWLSKSIASGNSCTINATWSSTEDDLPTGNGVLTLTVKGAVKLQREVAQGNINLDVSAYLSAGAQSVKLTVADVYGNTRAISYSVTVVSLSLTSTFDNSVPYSDDIPFAYTPVGNVDKTMHFVLDDQEIDTFAVSSSREQTYTMASQPHGAHTLRVWFTAELDGVTVASNELYYEFMSLRTGNVSQMIISDFQVTACKEYDVLIVDYYFYDPTSLTAAVTLSVNGTVVSEQPSVDRTKQRWSYRTTSEGTLTLEIAGSSATKTFTVEVADSGIDVSPESSNLELYLSSSGRSNNEENPGMWENNGVSAVFSDFNYTSDGWQIDDNGITALRVTGDARLEIPLMLFSGDPTATGKTVEVEFATRSVIDYEAVILSCMSGGRGIEITSQMAMLRSEQSSIGTQYKEEEHIRLAFVIEKSSANRFVYCYINGIMSGVVQYPAGDDFSQATPVSIEIGSNDCTIDLYCVRVYNNALTRYQVLNNWIADTQDGALLYDRYTRNQIYDDYDQIAADNLPQNLPYLVIICPVLPAFKGDKKMCSGYYVNPLHPEKNFSFANAVIDVQGTSSQYYYVKNWKIKFENGFILTDGTTIEVYQLNDNVIPTNTYTFKADVASSEGANNVVLAELYNELCPVKIPAQEDDPRVRQTIDGHPIVIFWDSGDGNLAFAGKYNFNHDKGTEEIFGFTTGDESWEILQNGTDRVGFRSADFSEGSGWEDDFEARYPEDNTDTTTLAAFSAWVVSTDPDQATGNAIEAVTLDGVEYTADTSEYRLAKYKVELPEHAKVNALVFYYVFTEVFLCIDQREKNAFPTFYVKWLMLMLVLFYDADSSLGTDNKGKLTFPYYLEDIDYTDAGEPVYNGQNSVLWANLRKTHYAEIEAEYRRLRTTVRDDGSKLPLLSYEVVDNYFENHQSVWPEAIYNEDGFKKSLEAMILNGDATYLSMLQGKKEQHRKWWLYNRFRYLDSKYCTGTSMTNRILIRAHTKGAVRLVAYVNMHGHVFFNSEHVTKRMERGESYLFESAASGAEDTVIGINDADLLTDIGDISGLNAESIDISGGYHLIRLKAGDGADTYSNGSLASVTLGNNTLMRIVDVRNCKALTSPIDASGCTNIEELYFDGTALSGITLPDGGVIRVLHLPETVASLIIKNQTKITDFQMAGYSQITTLRLENVSSAIDSAAIVQNIADQCRVRLLDVEWHIGDTTSVEAIIEKLSTCSGLDEYGSKIDSPIVTGALYVDAITDELLGTLNDMFPELIVYVAGVANYLVRYENWDGTLLYRYAVSEGSNAIDPVADGLIEEPTRETDAYAAYTYSGWSKLPTDIHSNVTVIAQYDEAYVVTYCNWDGTVLQTFNVAYDGSCMYTGSTPTKASDAQYSYTFKGWLGAAANGSVTHVKQNKTITAQYTSTVRTYTAYFYNENMLLETVTNVPYGTVPTYSGATPEKTDGGVSWPFVGWEPEIGAITGNTSYYAQFESPVQVAEITDSWDAVMASIADGTYKTRYKLGNWIALDCGSQGIIDYQIAGFDVDEAADGSGKVAITWLPVQLFATTHRMNPSFSGSYAVMDGVPAWYGCNNVWTSNTGGAIADAAATWMITADEDQTLTIRYKTSNSNAGRNCIDITVNGTAVATDKASTSFSTYTIELIAGETVEIAATYSLLNASYSYYGTVEFSSTGAFTTEIENGTVSASAIAYDDHKGTGAIGGWEYSEMRAYCNDTLLPLLPENVRNAIKTVKKKHPAYMYVNRTVTQVTEDKGWIPSYEEMFSSSADPNYTTVYDSNDARVKYVVGASSASWWWLRSANSYNYFYCVSSSGSNYTNSAHDAYGVALGFST